MPSAASGRATSLVSLAGCLLVTILATTAHAAPPLFDTWRGYPTGTAADGRYPWAAALGDLDHDGAADVVTAQGIFASTVTVLRNQGDGSYGAPARYATPLPSLDVAVGDFNGDGWLDVVASNTGANYEGSSVSLFLNQGNGTLSPRRVFSVGAGSFVGPVGLAVDDFDGDGRLDVVVARYGLNGNGSTVALLRGDGAGNLAAPAIYAAAGGPYKVAAGDMNGDGRPDVVVANLNQKVTVLLNNGAGGFAPAISYNVLPLAGGDFFPAVELADVDHDGDLDVFYSSTRTWIDSDTGVIALFHNAGNGALTGPQTIPMLWFTAGPADLAAADLNGDGWVDVLGAHYDGRAGDGWEVAMNDGAGGFLPATRYPGGQTTVAALAGDVDGDHVPDVLSVDNYSLEVTVHHNPGNGVFATAPTYPVEAVSIDQDAADIDGDGDLDLLVSGGITTGIQPSVLKNNGDGTFAPRVVYSYPGGLAYGRLRDLNGDGRPDLLLATASPPYNFVTAMNLGGGTFGPYTTWQIHNCGSGGIEAVDLDGDHDLDVCYLENEACISDPTSGKRLYVSLNQGNGTFGQPTIYAVEVGPYSLRVGDLNHDGHPDLAIAHWGAYGSNFIVGVLLGVGNGTLQPAVFYPVGQGSRDLVIADLNGDGNPDIATGNTGLGDTGVETMSVLFGRGDGTFQDAITYDGSYSPDLLGSSGIAAGDPDFDGDVDLMVSNYGSSDFCFYQNQGNGTFAPPIRYGLNKGAFAPVYADFTGDGIADVAAVVGLPPSGDAAAVTVVRGLGSPLTAVIDAPSLAGSPLLGPPQPNPLRGRTELSYVVPADGPVRLGVYDVAGRLVRMLVDGTARRGAERAAWDGRDSTGRLVSAGVYFARYETAGVVSSRKIAMVR